MNLNSPLPVVSPNDVFFGRGKHAMNRPGNQYYHALISAVKDTYMGCTKNNMLKQRISERIFECVQSLNPPGRFLCESRHNVWTEVDKKDALKRISQALREKKCHITKAQHAQTAQRFTVEQNGLLQVSKYQYYTSTHTCRM